jgi:hypothetical protein
LLLEVDEAEGMIFKYCGEASDVAREYVQLMDTRGAQAE